MDRVSWSLGLCQNPPPGGRPDTKPDDHGIPNANNFWYILFYHVWGPAWIITHWYSIWLRSRSLRASHYNWGFVTTLHDFGGDLGRALDIFFWALRISWSSLLARVWSGLKALIGRKDWDRPSSLHTRRWRPKDPKILSWMQSLHGFLNDKL